MGSHLPEITTLLLAFGVCLSPLRTLVEFAKAFEDFGRAWTVPNGQTLVLFEVGINVALVVLEVATMVAMLNRYRAFIKLLIWLWAAAFVLPLADMVVTALLFPQIPSEALVAEALRIDERQIEKQLELPVDAVVEMADDGLARELKRLPVGRISFGRAAEHAARKFVHQKQKRQHAFRRFHPFFEGPGRCLLIGFHEALAHQEALSFGLSTR